MALTILIEPGAAHEGAELALTLDAPRIVIGRSKSCEVQLPDPTVSARHASIRHEGGRSVIVDEGSTNGIVAGRARLPAQTQHTLSDGELVRVGRVWIEIRFATAPASQAAGVSGSAQRAQAVALELLARRLRSQGEDVAVSVRVVDGPDQGRELVLDARDREYVIGRSREADLMLTDELVSRRHVTLGSEGAGWRVRDHDSKRGSTLGDGPLSNAGAKWAGGKRLMLGSSVLELHDPVADALEELWATPDVRMRADELADEPPGADPETQASEAADDDREALEPPSEPSPEPAAAGYGTVDFFVVLLALGLLALSIAGLTWVLR